MPDEVVDPVLVSVAAYSAHADEYAARHAARYLDRVQRFAAWLPVPSRILDAGCGPGRDMVRFRSLGHVVRGIDLNPAFAALAGAHAPTRCADLRDVGSLFTPGTFDAIWANASLVHLSEGETGDVLRQFATLVRPGGRLYACVHAVGETGWLAEHDGRRWYTVWEPQGFASAVSAAGFAVEEVATGAFAEVWATRDPVAGWP